MKRGLLYTCCVENGYNKLLLAQHLDDLVESLFMSLMHNGQVGGRAGGRAGGREKGGRNSKGRRGRSTSMAL
ncbi:pp-loop domain protein [Nannochloropsis gaditana]|uniref:Pp-loop domain protein n=1 Tax=Nannochloropsis gaditana TaxID=72520 RepID=W7UAQ3_9STRA|nr:pp-loop domain protein [Nannochloropsis gaditana]